MAEQFYVEVDGDDTIMGVYSDQRGQTVPPGAVEITQEEKAILAAAGTFDRHLIQGGVLVPDPTWPDRDADRKADLNNHQDEILRAFALVWLDEINILRELAGEPPRTGAQLKAAIKAKL